jgi:hypothetical protein
MLKVWQNLYGFTYNFGVDIDIHVYTSITENVNHEVPSVIE